MSDLITFSPNTKIVSANINGNFTKIDTRFFTGWNVINETLTCGADNVLTGSSALVAYLNIGDKIWLLDDGVAWYGYVMSKPSSTSFSVLGGTSAGAAGTIASGSTVTIPYYSKVQLPTGHPEWFDVASPTFTLTDGIDNGAGGQPTTNKSRFRMVGKTAECFWQGNGVKAASSYVLAIFTSTNSDFPPIKESVLSATLRNYLGGCYALYGSGDRSGAVYYYVPNTTFLLILDNSVTDNTTVTDLSARWSYEV